MFVIRFVLCRSLNPMFRDTNYYDYQYWLKIIKLVIQQINQKMCAPEAAGKISRAGSHGFGHAAIFGRKL